MDTQQVQHHPSQPRFELHKDGEIAVLDYHIEGNLMVISHTYVPPALRGGGLAAALVRAALDEARKQGWKIRSQCSYVSAFLERHRSQYQDLA